MAADPWPRFARDRRPHTQSDFSVQRIAVSATAGVNEGDLTQEILSPGQTSTAGHMAVFQAPF